MEINDLSKLSEIEETDNYRNDADVIEEKIDYIREDDITDNDIVQIEKNYLESDDIDIQYDDNGELYKINGELLSDVKYEISGINYETNEYGNIVSWDGDVQYTPDGERDNKAQLEVGGIYRLDGDDGGHLVSRINGGSDGIENMVPMRDTINRGDYKRAENEITEALKDGKNVTVHGNIRYEETSSRPDEIVL